MIGLSVKGLLGRKLRGVLTALAVFLGVAMVAGTLMLTDSVNQSFDDIFAEANEGVDVSVRAEVEVEGGFDAPEAGTTALSENVLPTVEGVAGVQQASGAVGDPTIAILDEQGDRIGPPQGGPPHIAFSVQPEPFNSFTYVDGAAPASDDEVGIDTITADEEGYAVGDTVTITGVTPAKEYTISGLARFGSGVPLAGASLATFTLPEAQRLTGKEGEFDEIAVEAESGTSPEELKIAVAAAVPPGVQVRTGEEIAIEDADDLKSGFSFLSTTLLVFAGIALFVGAFLIFNTFSITVAQRTREFAMLRTLGASARQVLGTVLLEAVLIGLFASILGILGGIGFVELITALFSALGFELPSSGLVIGPATIIVPLVIGLVATTVSSAVPAVRATRVAPLEALREGSGARGSEARQRRRTAVGASLVVVGAIAIAFGLFGSSSVGSALPLIGVGLILLFIGVAVLANRMVRPLASLIGWPIERIRGVIGRLARENTLRNPSRTATTAAALMIGVALVTFVAVFAAAISRSFDDALDRQFAGDLIVLNTDGFSPIPPAVSDQVTDVEGVAVVSPFTAAIGRVEGVSGEVQLDGIDPDSVAEVANIDFQEGGEAALAELNSGGALVEQGFAEGNDIAVGDQLSVTAPDGGEHTFTVAGTVDDQAGLVVQDVAVSGERLRADFDARLDLATLVSFDEGVDFDATRDQVDEQLGSAFPNTETRSQQQLKDDQREQIQQLLVLIYALLGLSVIVSLFGVVNTLVLTIHERTRELGMLRAIGTSKRQVRQMVRYESVITALIGAILGAAIGLVLAIAAVQALSDEGLVLSVPVLLILLVIALAGIAGVLAAIAPARRASRLNVVEALQYE